MDIWTPPTIVTPDEDGADSVQAQDWLLTRRNTQAAALSLVRPDGVSLTVDFVHGKSRHRTTESGNGAQALTKALGIKAYVKSRGTYPTIIDATGGLGQDAWALASTGCQLLIIEQHPVVHALLADGLARARNTPECANIAERISLHHGDASQHLQALVGDNIHAIYLDPMYPERRRKANSKKGMQFLHALLGPPKDDDPALLLSALRSGVSRVAVKRPKGAPLLSGTDQFAGQRTVIETPNTRYDVYHCR
ncbi:MAG: class I SAM-dependent methyltransferase [Granulosicoccus sp.]